MVAAIILSIDIITQINRKCKHMFYFELLFFPEVFICSVFFRIISTEELQKAQKIRPACVHRKQAGLKRGG